MKRLLIVTILIAVTAFTMLFSGCSQLNVSENVPTAEPVVTPTPESTPTATAEPTQSPDPYVTGIPVRSNLGDEDYDAPNFQFVCNYDLDGDGNEDEIKLMVENYDEPTLVVGDTSVKFSEHMLGSYNCGSCFKIADVDDGKLIYFVSLGGRNRGYDAHCAYYENGTLYEVRFPEWLFFTADKDDPFVGTWTGDNTIDIECLYDNSIKHVTVDTDKIDGFDPSWRDYGFGAILDDEMFDYGPGVIDDTVHVRYDLTMCDYVDTYAHADCVFKFDKDNMSMTFVSVTYSATYYNSDAVTFQD